MRSNTEDQLVHPPVPVVKFATDAAAQSVTGPLRERYEQAATFAYTEWQQADQCDNDMNGWQAEITESKRRIAEEDKRVAEREQWIQRRTLDKQQHLTHAQQAVDIAGPTGELLAVAGVQVPPVVRPLPLPPVDPSLRAVQQAGRDLPEELEGSLTRFNAAHDELAAEGDVR